MHNPLNLTFGIEIECVVVFDPAKYEPGVPVCEGVLWDPERSKDLSHQDKLQIICRNHIAELFKQKGFATYDLTSTTGGDNEKWTVASDASVAVKDGLRDDGFMECDVEIRSPALRFCQRALHRVQRVVRLLTTEFDVFVNESCGFHVHVGNRKSGFPLQTLKNLCMLTAVFEYQLNSLHPPDRIGNPYAKLPSAVFQGLNPWDSVALIQSCKTTTDLVLLYAKSERYPDKCFAYNFLPLIEGFHKTIEFRQHKGTLDWVEMINWVQVAGGMVDAVHESSADGMAKLIRSYAFDARCTVLGLFQRLRLDQLVPFYRGVLHVHARTEPIWVLERMDGGKEAGPRRRWAGLERWDDLERRHRIERLREIGRLEELDKRHELERTRELERQDEEV